MQDKTCKQCGSEHLSYERQTLECFDTEEQLLTNKKRIPANYTEITYSIVCDSCGLTVNVRPK